MRPYSWFLTLLIFSFNNPKANSQPNACNVKAGFDITPVEKTVDGVTYTYYSFQNTSTGATNVVYSFYDGIFQEFWGEINFPAGPRTIKQIAINGSCRDTLVKVLFVPGRMPTGKPNVSEHLGHLDGYFQPQSISTTTDDHLILGSWEFLRGYTYCHLIKMDRYGCIKKAISSNETTFLGPVSSDGKGNNILNFYATRWFGNGVIRLSDNLDISWAKVFTSPYGVLAPNQFVHLAAGEFISRSIVPFEGPGLIPDLIFARHQADGTVKWAKHLQFPGYGWSYTTNMAVIGDRLFAHVQNSDWVIDHFITEEQIIAFDLNTGNIIWQKRVGTPEHMFWTNDLAAQNGKLIITGYWDDPARDPEAVTTIIQMDIDGKIERMADLLETGYFNLSAGGTYKIRDIDGQHFYLQLYGFIKTYQEVNYLQSVVIKMNPDWTMDWKKGRGEHTLAPIGFGNVMKDGSLAGLGTSFAGNNLRDFVAYNLHYQAFDKDVNKDTRICNFQELEMQTKYIASSPTVFSLPIVPYSDIAITAKDTTVETGPVNITTRYTDPFCNDYLDSCSMIKITGPEEICNLQDTYTFKAWRNPACSQDVSWELPASASIVQKTGNTIAIKFSAAPEGFIKAFIQNSCSSVRDSVHIKFSDRFRGPVYLGNDTSLCPNSFFNLEPVSGYDLYTWSDGSNGNFLRVEQPGKYWLEVQDACGAIYSDTIVVAEKLKDLVFAGPDLDLCVGTPAVFNAPAGYDNYRWTNEQFDLVSSTAALILPTGTPGNYFLEAQKAGSCTAFDTVVVKNKIAPALSLGADTSICKGASVRFEAGNGFASYQWNNGATTPGIPIHNAGKYTVTATDANGCKVVASRQLLTVYELPQINLNKSTYLCKGENRILDAGAGFEHYTWQDGSAASTFTIHGPGKYWVTVSDNHQCIKGDTVEITRITEPPSGFLAADTTICFYGEKRLAPGRSYAAYEWSTGEKTESIKVKNPGEYVLVVTDGDGCQGRDQIILTGVQCMMGVHFPNAFTPNGDGRNDVFKPLVYSQLEQYNFKVFNRFGQLVFSSSDPQKGWDGLVNGKGQDPNTFTWTCTYKLVGQSARNEKGIVVLSR